MAAVLLCVAAVLITVLTFLSAATSYGVIGLVAALLLAICLWLLSRYRLGTTVLSGSVSLVISGLVLVYLTGSLPRENPILYTNPGPDQWNIYLIGFVSMVVGALIGGLGVQKAEHRAASSTSPRLLLGQAELRWNTARLVPFVVLAILIGAINYGTGTIPLLANDINGSRLNGQYGVLGRYWPLLLPILQVAVFTKILLLSRGRVTRLWMFLGGASLVILVLNGGRSLFVISLLAFALVFIEFARPKLLHIAAVAAAGIVAFGLIGIFRASGSANASAGSAYLSERNLDSWFGSTDLSLQTGPQVMSLALKALHGELLNGAILLGDIQNFFNSSSVRSDRIVTALLGRDPNVLGGLPPTLWGGFAIDFGITGVVVGGFLVGLVLGLSRKWMLRTWTLASAIWFGYIASYILLSSYSYISVRPSWIVVGLLVIVVGKEKSRGDLKSVDGFEVSKVSGGR